MVKTLFRYECKAYRKHMLPLWAVVLGMGTLNRLIQLFENETRAYSIVFWSSVIAMGIAAVVCMVMTVVEGIRRFYKNLYTKEGYLSFTLPVTTGQHLTVKTLGAVLCVLLTCIIILLSACIAASWEPMAEAWKAFGYLVRMACRSFEEAGYPGYGPLLIAEGVLLSILTIAGFFIKVYACIAIGQTARKNRILSAVGIFFGIYVLKQILATAAVIRIDACGSLPVLQTLLDLLDDNPARGLQSMMLLLLGTVTAVSAVYAFLTLRMMNRHLNLE